MYIRSNFVSMSFTFNVNRAASKKIVRDPSSGVPSKTSQAFLFFGFKYIGNVSKKLGVTIEAAVVKIKYKEEALEMEETGSTNGFGFETGAVYNLGKRFFLELSAGFIYASEVLFDKKVKFGGFKAGLGLGVKL